MLSPLFIINPVSGSHGGSDDLARVLSRVEEMFGDVVIRYTARRGHARTLAREGAIEGHSLVVAVGGDGTFSEVANGVLEATVPDGGGGVVAGDIPAVGLINFGTGGDFRRSLGIGAGYESCLAALALGRERLVDVGSAVYLDGDGETTRRYFVNVLSAGLGGLVDRYIETMPSFVGGRAGYYIAALRAVLASKERFISARITWQGHVREETIPAYLIAVCNGRWFGGGMDVAPMALPDDGRLEVVTVTARSKPYLARQVRTVYEGRHLDEPTVHHFPCERIELGLEDAEAERHFLLDVDGDALGSLPLAVEVVPRRLRVRC